MALLIKLLEAKPTAAAANTPVYSSTASTVVANIRFATKAQGGTVNLKYLPGGVSANARQLLDIKSIAANDILVVKPEITMGPGDTIEATTSVAMDCVVSGFTRD